MQVIIDTETLAPVIGSLGATVVALIMWVIKKGYLQIWAAKLTTSLDEINALKQQNGNAITKLEIPDDVLYILESFEIDKMGHVVLKGEGRVSKLLRQDRPLTSYEKDEIIKAVRKILTCRKED
jgi:hypothetical protein